MIPKMPVPGLIGDWNRQSEKNMRYKMLRAVTTPPDRIEF